MLGLAEWSLTENLIVSGSDTKRSPATERLEALGARVRYNHDGSEAAAATVVVHSTAVKKSNPELSLALAAKVPVISRGQFLGELSRHRQTIAICGSHGKSTTSALMGHCLRSSWPAHVYLGAVAKNFGSSFHAGNGHRLIAEVDESDGTFLDVHNDLSVMTGLSNDHESFYGSRAGLYDAFATFLGKSSLLTLPVVCGADPEVSAFVRERGIATLRYGFDDQCHVIASGVSFHGHLSRFSVARTHPRQFARASTQEVRPTSPIAVELPMLGLHNVLNALAVFGVADQLGIPWHTIAAAMSVFAGVERRLERLISLDGLTVYSDYAHNPQKISALIASLNNAYGSDQVVCVFEPHRFTRLQSMWHDFVSSLAHSQSLCLLPLYTAGEAPIPGVNNNELIEALRVFHQRNDTSSTRRSILCQEDSDPSFSAIVDLVDNLPRSAKPRAVVFLGAGRSHELAHHFVDLLGKRHGAEVGINQSKPKAP
jgi:UDP-N-acetylmuramate--alanine ligase